MRSDIADSELGSDDDVTIDVSFSAINYKDALALQGSPGVVRTLPLIPGIDAAGVVRDSPDPRFSPGDRVVVTGFGYGETRHGGLATALKASAEHLVRIPDNLSDHQAASYGTAGFTAALAVRTLEEHGITAAGAGRPVAVTGAAGAVGSLAVFFLARHGFAVTAITGRTDEADYLISLGASDVLSRQEVLSWPNRPLLGERFSAVIDQAGGALLATLIASVEAGGVVAACGLAGGSDLPTTVMPFILRGVTLTGVNSVYQPLGVREELWRECSDLEAELPWDSLSGTIPLAEALVTSKRVLAGATRGRVVVDAAA